MKRRIPHVVPLSKPVIAFFNELRQYTSEQQFYFASPVRSGKHISGNTLLFALYRLGYRGRMTGHGFRAVVSTALNQSGLFSADAIERQLAQRECDAVCAA